MGRQAYRAVRRLAAAAAAVLTIALTSCSFVEEANEFDGGGEVNLLFPFDALGLSSALPEVKLGVRAGFSWHNDEEQHRFWMEKTALQAKIEAKDYDLTEEVLSAFRTRAATR